MAGSKRRKVIVSEDVLEKIMSGEVKVRRDFKIKYGRYSIKGLKRILEKRGLGVGSKS